MKSILVLIALVLVVFALQGSFGKKRKTAVKHDKDGDITDIVTTEGEEGWLEKVLEKAKTKKQKKPPSKKGLKARDTFYNDSPPGDVITSVESSLNNVKTENNKQWITRTKNGLSELKNRWLETPEERRGEIIEALKTAAGSLQTFANAGEDPVGAIRAAIDVVASFASLAGPKGQVVSLVLSFVSGLLSLFGKGSSPKPVDQVVREEIERWYSRDLGNQAEGAIEDFKLSNVFLDGVAKSGEPLDASEQLALASHVPVYRGVEFMGTLASEIRNIIRNNQESYEEAKKCLKYIELYATQATLKDMILQQMAALLTDSQRNIRNGIYAVQGSVQTSAKELLKFLYESKIGNNIIPYFDPDQYRVTDAYMTKVLKVDNYDRSMAGKYLLEIPEGRLGYTDAARGIIIPLPHGNNFRWKLVPHGLNLFSIVNQNRQFNLYDAMLSWKYERATIEYGDPVLWEITRRSKVCYRIRSTKGCNKNPPDEMCKAELTMRSRSLSGFLSPNIQIKEVIITKGSGKCWKLRKV